MVTAIFGVITLSMLVIILFWMNAWGQAPDKTEPKFALVYLLFSIISGLGYMTLYYFVLKSPILMNMYKDMIRAIMFSPLSYFENTPVAKIVQRISYDL
jgi:ABC-type multidrug transport system fused ATPase/permease subunit